MIALRRFLFFLCLAATAGGHAQTLEGQRLIYSAQHADGEYRLSLGALKKINSVWTAAREIRVKADITQNTYELDSSLNSVEQVWSLVEDEWKFESARRLFSCVGLDCGSSNAWANDRFGVKQLYGMDQSQHYAVLEFKQPKTRFLVVYLVQRGNRRIYLQVDNVLPKEQVGFIAADPQVLLETLEKGGYVVVDNLDADMLSEFRPDEKVKALISALKIKPFQKYYVVGHSRKANTLEENRELSLQQATAFTHLLVKAGIDAKRLEAVGVGDLAPREGQDAERIEIVLKK